MKVGLIILGMAIVTYLPRVIPLVLGRRLVLPVLVRRWLELIPYAALGALIFPGILTVDPARPWIGMAAGAAAAIAAFFWRNPLVAVATAMGVMFLAG